MFARSSTGRIKFSASIMATLLDYRQSSPRDHEGGGVLLGRHIAETDDVVVDHVTVPQGGDRRTRYRFLRQREQHQELIDRAWRESKGTITYLGEWHTHPEAVPIPSMIDRMDWSRKLWADDFSDALLFVIVGTEAIGVWEGRRRRFVQTALREIDRVIHDH